MTAPPTLPGLLRRAAATEPERVAVTVQDGGALTYGTWEKRSDAQAHGLQHAGVRPGERVALVFDAARWTEYAVTYIAVLKAGAVAVPLRAHLAAVELGAALRDCEASALVGPEIVPPGASTPILPLDELEGGGGEPALTPSLSGSTPAEILYAASPLSAPVAVPRSHRSLLGGPGFLFAPAAPSLLHSFPVGTLAGQDALCASLGATPVCPVTLPGFDPDRLCTLLEAGPTRACSLHPASARAVLDSGAAARHDLSRVTALVLTSGRPSPALLVRLATAFPGARLLAVDVLGSARRARTLFLHDRSRPGSVGRPAANTAVRVTDDAGRPVRSGEVGRVWVRGLGEAGAPREEGSDEEGGDGEDAVATDELGYLDDQGLLHLVGGGHDVAPDPGPPAPATIAFSQEGMLWHEQFAPGSQNLPGLGRRYRGPLDVQALGRALDEIVRRHGALRTTYALRSGRPVQVVHHHRPRDLPVRDLGDRPPEEREGEVRRLVAEAGRRPFDLVAGPLFETTLLRLGPEDHVLVIRTHHSVFDDWSVGIFRRELAALYGAYAAGEASPLPELSVAFADFSRRQRRALAGPAGARELAFWRRELAGAPFTTQLPVDDPSLPEGSPQAAGEPISLTLPAELRDGLGALARRERATIFMTVLAAFGVLVHRYTGQKELLLATVVANRNRTELEGVIGCFTKKVPLRLRLSGDPAFTEVLARTRAALLGALGHQDLPFEAVIQDVLGAPAAAHGLAPHAAVMFQGVTPRQELALPGVETTGLETSTREKRAHFMAAGEDGAVGAVPALAWGAGLYLGTFVILSLIESPEELSCVARGAFHGPAMGELLRGLNVLLADVVAHPARPVSELAVLDRSGRARVLERGRGPAEPLIAGTLPGAFGARVRRDPDAVAVHAPGDAVTYAELDARSDRLAERLRGLGAGPDAPVGIALAPSTEAVVAALATWKAGAAWVGLDPADAEDRLAWIVADASLAIVIGDPGCAAVARHVRVVGPEADGEGEPTAGLSPSAVGPDDAALVFYGSGPSAVAHGVVLDHRAVLSLLTGLRHAVLRGPGVAAPRRRVWLGASPTQEGFLRQLVALLDGHQLHAPVAPRDADPCEAVSLVGTGEVDLLDCTPDELEILLGAGLGEAVEERQRSSVEPVLVVGTRGAVGPELWHALRDLPGARPHVLYGPPECAFGATVRSGAGASFPRGVGRAMAGLGSHVLDARGRPVPTRAVGELHLEGPSLARGWLGHAEATRERFFERVLEGRSTRLHRTGQLARSLPGGGVELLGPLDGDGELRGFRIDTARISAALARCPGVRDVAVEHEQDENGETRLVARVVVADGEPSTPARLRAFLWSRLPGYAWPSRLLAVSRPGSPERGEAAAEASGGPAELGSAPVELNWEHSVLGALWAEALGLEGPLAEENYWQAFSFLGALGGARDAGVAVPGELVTRNRTIETLAVALAAARCRPPARTRA